MIQKSGGPLFATSSVVRLDGGEDSFDEGTVNASSEEEPFEEVIPGTEIPDEATESDEEETDNETVASPSPTSTHDSIPVPTQVIYPILPNRLAQGRIEVEHRVENLQDSAIRTLPDGSPDNNDVRRKPGRGFGKGCRVIMVLLLVAVLVLGYYFQVEVTDLAEELPLLFPAHWKDGLAEKLPLLFPAHWKDSLAEKLPLILPAHWKGNRLMFTVPHMSISGALRMCLEWCDLFFRLMGRLLGRWAKQFLLGFIEGFGGTF